MIEVRNTKTLVSKSEIALASETVIASLRLCVFAPLALLGLFIASSFAADEDEDEKPVAAGQRFNITDQNFDQLVFGVSLNGNRITVVNGVKVNVAISYSGAEIARKRFEDLIDSETKWIDSRCHLTDAQKKKLRLAGRGDIDAYFQRVKDLRRKVVGRALEQKEYNELSMLKTATQNSLLNESSLFRKTLRHTLDDQQRADYQELLRQRQLEAVDLALAIWDRTGGNNNNAQRVVDAQRVVGMNLSPEVRQKIGALIVAQGRLPESHSPYINYIVLLEANRIADQVRPLMSEKEQEAFEKLVTKAKQLEPTIRRYSQWPPASAEEDEAKE